MTQQSNLIEELDLSFHPLTQKLWRDFELLFGDKGACGGCWCMYWKLTEKAYKDNKGDGNRQQQKSIIDAKKIPGLIAYSEGYPIGWVAIEPRSEYPKLANSKIIKAIDNQEVWSITCLFIEKKHRHKGIMVELINAAVAHAKKYGAKIVEGYPVDSKTKQAPPFMFTGSASSFKSAGFKEVARNSATRPIFRYMLG